MIGRDHVTDQAGHQVDVRFADSEYVFVNVIDKLLSPHLRVSFAAAFKQSQNDSFLESTRNIARMLLTRRARMEGFLVFQYAERYQEGLDRLARWIRDGSLKYREDVVEGIENSPSAFIGLLEGANFGKLVIKVS